MSDNEDIQREFAADRAMYDEDGRKVSRMAEGPAKVIPRVREISEGKNISDQTGVEPIHPLRLVGLMVEESNWCDLAVNTIAANCSSSVPLFRVTTANGKKKSATESIQQILEFPNLHQDGKQLFYQTYLDLGTYGNAYWQVIKSRDGELHSIYTLPPETMRVIPYIDEDYILRCRYVQINSTPMGFKKEAVFRIFEEHEIVHFKRPNQKSFLYGKPIFYTLMTQVASSINAAKAISAWFEEGLTAGAIFKQDADPEIADRNREYFNEMFSKPENFGKIMVLEGGIELVSNGFKFKDLDFAKLSATHRDEIITSAGVPLSVAGVRSDSGNANAEVLKSEESAFKRNTVDTFQGIVFGTITNKLFRQILGRKDLKIEAGTLKEFDSSNAINIVNMMAKFGISINEARDILGLGRVPSEEAGNTYLISTNNGSAPADVITGVNFITGERAISILEQQGNNAAAASGLGGQIKDKAEGS